MLSTAVYIDSPTSLGSGDYRFNAYFNPSSKAKYLNVGDYVKDSTNNEYSVTSFTAPFEDGQLITAHYVTSDALPAQDSDYNSTCRTPGQLKLTSDVFTSGSCGAFTVYNATNYEYSVTVGWDSSVEANKAIVGDHIMDSQGKLLEITYIDGTDRFNVPIRVKEVDRVGEIPSAGASTMFRPTINNQFFQGTPVSDPARNVIRNRDSAYLDLITLPAIGGGGVSTKSVIAGEPISLGKAVSRGANGKVYTADSDSVNGQKPIGISTQAATGDGSVITITLLGFNISGVLSGLGFTTADTIYVSETAGYTNDPASFIGGNDSIIKLGYADCSGGVASSSASDLLVNMEVIMRPAV